jgi:hypothetical protein
VYDRGWREGKAARDGENMKKQRGRGILGSWVSARGSRVRGSHARWKGRREEKNNRGREVHSADGGCLAREDHDLVGVSSEKKRQRLGFRWKTRKTQETSND